MKIAVSGSKGKLGSRLVALGAVPLTSDILDQDSLRRELVASKPNVVIHAAGISSIERCEKDLEAAILVNTRGSASLFEAVADEVGEGRCILLSSEQVFDGKQGLYVETDEPNPINDYGRTKFAAEGLSELYGNKTIRLSRCVGVDETDISEYLSELSEKRPIRVPDFIFRSYAHLDHIAQGIWHFANHFDTMPELLHLGGSVSISFFSFMKFLAQELELPPLVSPRTQELELSQRPYKCGFNVSLAQQIGVPIFTPYQAIDRIKTEWKQKHPL